MVGTPRPKGERSGFDLKELGKKKEENVPESLKSHK